MQCKRTRPTQSQVPQLLVQAGQSSLLLLLLVWSSTALTAMRLSVVPECSRRYKTGQAGLGPPQASKRIKRHPAELEPDEIKATGTPALCVPSRSRLWSSSAESRLEKERKSLVKLFGWTHGEQRSGLEAVWSLGERNGHRAPVANQSGVLFIDFSLYLALWPIETQQTSSLTHTYGH